ncbi:CHAT domain-containing protein [Actinomadura chibensis]|uniref:CHAT domain-containing protein n=1 Tax=Actinomadura chibensis TaxID=392828 RepID=A0A5D0NU55_9ACTN|nr:CHAT domain-containing protein [Actinomadura chibensis]TYB47895.1 CHAT domain-containing protein [Actinomadura chibensis]
MELCGNPALLDPLDDAERARQLLHFGVLLSYLLENEAHGLAPRPLESYVELIVRSPDPHVAAMVWMMVSGILGGLGAREISAAADARIQSWLKESKPQFRDVFLRETRGVASAVGAALHDEAENRTHRYPDLRTLIDEAPEEDDAAAPLRENEAHLRGLGHGALRAASLCEHATEIDALSPEERAEGLAAFVAFLNFVVEKKVWHLAPRPLASYPILCPLFEDPVVRAHAVGCAASITRESGRVQDSFDLLLTLETDLPRILPEQAVTFRLHGANTLRDLRRLDEASDWYARAEQEAERLDPGSRAAVLDDIAHQDHRRSHYTGRSEGRPGRGTEYDPNPFLPGSVFNDPERWRRRPWQLLTLAQNARHGDDPVTAYEALTHLVDVAAPSDHDLLASAHNEVAELADMVGAPARVTRWHGFLCLCATVLSGNHRELGGRLSRQATRLASLDDHLSAFTLARWAMGADHVPLYTAGIQADIGYVLLRNGTLEASRERFESSLESVPGDGLVQAQKAMVETLLGLPAAVDDEPGRRLSPTGETVQGAGAAHAIAFRSGSAREVTVADIPVGRAAAQDAVGALKVAPAVPDAAERLAAALREAAGGAAEVSLRLREPWEQVPVENLPDATGRSLAQDHVVVRRHGRRPRFGLATVPFPDRVEVLGDPMGPEDALGLPGALDEARAVADLFGTVPVVQDQVTWERLRYSARTADLLWLSTHCEPVPELGGAAALRLHDRWVLPSELAALDVNPGLVVVLTICAGGRAVPLGRVSEPPTATAFLRAGADLVISPLRPIRDTTWSPLIVDALTRTLDTDPTPAALVRALNAATPGTEPSAPWIMHA